MRAIEVKNVSTVYEGESLPAISKINLSIDISELVYIVGPNGAGKTTLLETINGLLTPVEGEVFVLGRNIRGKAHEMRREMGYVPQNFSFDEWEPYTALQVVLMGRFAKLGLLSRPSSRDYEKALEAMKLLEVEELADKPIGKLSGGQQQRVLIARAIAKEPRILLLDEPFSNLDPRSRRRILEVLRGLQRKGTTIVIVTHVLEEISRDANRAVFMMDGRIVMDDRPEAVLRRIRKWTS